MSLFICSAPTRAILSGALAANAAIAMTGDALGNLVHDGPATPEQISLWLPVTGSVPQTATAACRYKITGASTWTTGHPLYRIQPSDSPAPNVDKGPVVDGFAWPIIDLLPGTSYDVEVTVSYSTTTVVKTLTHTTRALPAAAGAANKTANSLATLTTALAGLVAGDVLEIAAGTYTVGAGLAINIVNRAGTLSQPIIIRGASRTGTILEMTTTAAGRLFFLIGAQHIILENMTLKGTFNHTLYSRAIDFHDDSRNAYITARNIIALGFSSFFYAQGTPANGEFGAEGCLVYNNTIEGVCTWTRSPVDFPGTTISWGNDGINIGGNGSCAWQNTIKGFGDVFACATHADTVHYTSARGVHFYRNDVRNTCDDSFEADYGRRNLTLYDNRFTNCINALSVDPIHGGPLVMARNIFINLFRQRPWKLNTSGSGFFIYNNTLVMGVNGEASVVVSPYTGVASYVSGVSGSISHKYYGYQNNIFIWNAPGDPDAIFYHENVAHNPIDWTHNCHWPDNPIRIGGFAAANLAGALATFPATTPVFSLAARKFENDSILASAQPFTSTITLGANADTEITASYTPTLAAGAAKNTGTTILGVTDGFSGAAPDRGAIISGRAVPTWGDQTATTGTLPAVGEVRSFGSVSLNQAVGRTVKWWGSWSGIAWAPWWGAHGSVIAGGGGHGDGWQNDLARLDIASRTWSMIKTPPASSFAKPDGFLDARNNADTTQTGWMYANSVGGDSTLQVGESPAQHHYNGLLALPESAIPGQGAVNGWLFHAGQSAIPDNGNNGAAVPHKLRLGIDQKYTLHGTPPHQYRFGNSGSVYDSLRKRVWFVQDTNDPTRTYRYKDLAAETEGTVDLSSDSIVWAKSYDSNHYSPSNDCIIRVMDRFGLADKTDMLVIDLAALKGYRPTQSNAAPATPNLSCACCWSEAWGAIAYIRGQGDNMVYFLKPTGDIRTAPWVWSSQPITVGTILPAVGAAGNYPAFNRLVHLASLGNYLLWCADESQPPQIIGVNAP